MSRQELTKAKAGLYLALLRMDEGELTDMDYEFMSLLLKDPDIQGIFQKALDNDKKK